jgi:signal transduction histidine kinase
MRENAGSAACEMDVLKCAFRSFDQAAATLQESYQALTARLERLDLELAASNEALRINLKENERMRAQLTAILESLTTGVIVADEAGTVIRCNQAAEALLGLPRAQLLGQPVATVLRERNLDQDAYPLATPTGIPVSLAKTTLRDDAGHLTGSIVLLHDISTVRRLEERLQRRDRLAAMGEMVGRIAHEIRNPLGSIELFASLLHKDLQHDPPRCRYAEHISMAVHALDRLLSNLLLWTKPERPRAAWHAPEQLVQDALTLTANVLARADLDVQVRCDPTIPTVWCDAFQIKQALVNLILNAVQAMPTGGVLGISVSKARDREGTPLWVRLSVSDTGVGIDPAHRSRLFDPFFTTRDGGTGLGLAIVHAIVEGHRGRIEVDSTVSRGSTFAILLPADSQEAAPNRALEGRTATCHPGKEEGDA